MSTCIPSTRSEGDDRWECSYTNKSWYSWNVNTLRLLRFLINVQPCTKWSFGFPLINSFPIDTTLYFSSVQSLSHVLLFVTPWITAHQASLSITNSQSWLKLMSIEWVMPSSHLILCRPLLLLPPIPLSIRVFSNESTLRMRWPKYWSFSFSICPSNEHPGLISFRMDWLGLLAVQGTLKSLLQHHSSKDQFFGAQLSSQFNSHIHTWPLEKP